MTAQARFLPEQMDANEASLMAARSAVEFAVDYSFRHVRLEGDAHYTVDTLIDSDEADSPYCTGILQETKHIWLANMRSMLKMRMCGSLNNRKFLEIPYCLMQFQIIQRFLQLSPKLSNAKLLTHFSNQAPAVRNLSSLEDMGREKMKMKKIEDLSARQVTFSKRRQGMFKKARELSILCDAEVAALVVSPAGRFHNYASSKIEDILCKFSMQYDEENNSADFQRENKNGVEHLNSGIDEKMKRLRLIMSMYLHKWGIEELQQLEMMLERILKRVTARKKEIMCKELPAPLQTKEYEKVSSTRTQSSEFRHCYQQISGPVSNMMNLEVACFPYSQIIKNIPAAQSGVKNYPEKWIPPPTDVYKANFARANFQEMNASGTGVVVRNWRGEFMAAQARFLPEKMDENAASSMAAKSAVEFAVEYYFTHVILEGDSHDTINILESLDENNPPDTTCTLQEAISYVKQLDRCSFSHVERSGNTAAHMVAQYAINVKDEAVWLIEEPEYLSHILLADAIHLKS